MFANIIIFACVSFGAHTLLGVLSLSHNVEHMIFCGSIGALAAALAAR